MPTAAEVAQGFDDAEDTTDDAVDDSTNDVDDTTNNDDSGDDNNSDDSNDSDGSKDDDADDSGDDDSKDKDAGNKKDDSADDDEGYLADDEGDDDDASAGDASPPAAPANFSAEDKYIIDNLPQITVRVRGADDSIKTVKVRLATELPQDMKGIASPYEAEIFHAAMAAQENAARQLQTYYRQHQTQLQAADFEKKENQSIRSDVADLQREGEIPRFKAQPGTKAFDNDPAAKVVQATIEFMNDRNDKYLQQSNAGGAYRHIGFAEAFELMKNQSSTDKNSTARKAAAGKLKTKQGGSADKTSKAPVSGRTIKEVAAEFDDEGSY